MGLQISSSSHLHDWLSSHTAGLPLTFPLPAHTVQLCPTSLDSEAASGVWQRLMGVIKHPKVNPPDHSPSGRGSSGLPSLWPPDSQPLSRFDKRFYLCLLIVLTWRETQHFQLMLCHVPFSLTSRVSWAWLPPSHRPVRPSAQWRAVPSFWPHKEGQTQCWEEVAGVRECTQEGPSPPRESHCLHRLASEHHSSHPLSPLAPRATSFPSSLFPAISLQTALPPMSFPNKPYFSDPSSPTLWPAT